MHHPSSPISRFRKNACVAMSPFCLAQMRPVSYFSAIVPEILTLINHGIRVFYTLNGCEDRLQINVIIFELQALQVNRQHLYILFNLAHAKCPGPPGIGQRSSGTLAVAVTTFVIASLYSTGIFCDIIEGPMIAAISRENSAAAEASSG